MVLPRIIFSNSTDRVVLVTRADNDKSLRVEVQSPDSMNTPCWYPAPDAHVRRILEKAIMQFDAEKKP